MADTKPDLPAGGWIADDFADLTSAGPVKDDPWSDQVSDAQGAAEPPASAGIQLQMIGIETEDDRGESVADDSDSVTPPIRVENVADTPNVYAENEEHQSIEDDGISYWQAGNEPETDRDLSLDGLGEETVLLDEPEPLAEYDSDLVEALYYADEDTEIRPIDLRLDELVSGIGYATAAERDQIYGLLSEFSSKRLSNWLTWLHDQEWTGKSLLLFLEFRDLWADTPQWWEYSVWSDWLNRWWTYSSPNVMSRDAAYEVIQQRLEYQADEIIEEAKGGSRLTQTVVTLSSEVHGALRQYAAAQDTSVDEAAGMLISEALYLNDLLEER